MKKSSKFMIISWIFLLVSGSFLYFSSISNLDFNFIFSDLSWGLCQLFAGLAIGVKLKCFD